MYRIYIFFFCIWANIWRAALSVAILAVCYSFHRPLHLCYPTLYLPLPFPFPIVFEPFLVPVLLLRTGTGPCPSLSPSHRLLLTLSALFSTLHQVECRLNLSPLPCVFSNGQRLVWKNTVCERTIYNSLLVILFQTMPLSFSSYPRIGVSLKRREREYGAYVTTKVRILYLSQKVGEFMKLILTV